MRSQPSQLLLDFPLNFDGRLATIVVSRMRARQDSDIESSRKCALGRLDDTLVALDAKCNDLADPLASESLRQPREALESVSCRSMSIKPKDHPLDDLLSS